MNEWMAEGLKAKKEDRITLRWARNLRKNLGIELKEDLYHEVNKSETLLSGNWVNSLAWCVHALAWSSFMRNWMLKGPLISNLCAMLLVMFLTYSSTQFMNIHTIQLNHNHNIAKTPLESQCMAPAYSWALLRIRCVSKGKSEKGPILLPGSNRGSVKCL